MTIKPLSQGEFVAMTAMLFATIAFSIDSMLPALPQIALELVPDAPNSAQLILTSFVLGMGIGTLFAGPLSDAFGRKNTIMAGAALYSLAALAAYFAPSMETVLAARLVQGLGAAGPRIVTLAMVRDLYRGRDMARIMSFTMMFFILVPAIAPMMGQVIIAGFGWRGVFLAFLVFSAVSMIWLGLRQPETLPAAQRRPLSVAELWSALKEVLSHRVILVSVAVQTLVFGSLFGCLSQIQPIFDQVYGRGDRFPQWFALIALASGLASITNARLVGRLGMRYLVRTTIGVQALLSLVVMLTFAANIIPDDMQFYVCFFWIIGVFSMAGLTIGNLNALALEPVGHIAGMAASVTGAISTVGAVVLAAPLGLAFNGTPLPLMIGITLFASVGWLLTRGLAR
jgi:DHA1 family bicyclomycin/chloramphenicol resistance-like MFS transporter